MAAPDLRSFRFGAPGADDSKRSPDEVRIIKEMVSEEVDAFLLANNIDVAASRELRHEPPHVALAVLERGPLRACVNPSGALMARIRDAKRGVLGQRGQYGGAPSTTALDANSSEVDRFLVENHIDQAGVLSFRSETPEIQKAVMAKGNFVNTTNPSASLMARIRTVKTEIAAGNVAVAAASSPGMPAGLSPGLAHILGLAGQQAIAPQGQDSRPVPPGAIQNGSLDDEARKAIEKLNCSMAQAAPPQGALPEQPGSTGTGPAQSFHNAGDANLNNEAFRVIQALNN